MRADYDIMCRINESIDMNKRTAQFLHSAKKKTIGLFMVGNIRL